MQAAERLRFNVVVVVHSRREFGTREEGIVEESRVCSSGHQHAGRGRRARERQTEEEN